MSVQGYLFQILVKRSKIHYITGRKRPVYESGEIMKKQIVLWIASTGMLLWMASCAADVRSRAAAMDKPFVTGIVFEDRNGNGIRDDGEKGIAGVLVSNQREVSKTDRHGRYLLPAANPMTVFVTKPAGYRLPLDQNNLPRFYYHHYPAGSPENLGYPGIPPSGPLPDSLDFPLSRSDESDEFTFMAIGDPQPQTHEELNYLRDSVIAVLPDGLAEFSITLGDSMFDRLELLPRYNEIFGRIGCPSYNVTGNHNLNYEADAVHCWDTFRRYYGPEYYSFACGKTHFMVLNTVGWHGKQTDDWWNNYKGEISPDQMTWIENTLRHIPADHLVVFAAHIPLYLASSGGPREEVADRGDFLNRVRGRKHLLFLAGHMHTSIYMFLDSRSGWDGKADFPQIVCGAVCGTWWGGPKDSDGIPAALQPDGAPSGVYLFHVRGNQVQEEFYPLRHSPDFQMRIASPRGTIPRAEIANTPIIANVFIGNERTTVTACLDGMEIPLRQTMRTDPLIEDLIKRYPDTYRSWVAPAASTHIWQANLPEDLTAGVYRLDIKATLHDKRVLTGKCVFEVSEDKQ